MPLLLLWHPQGEAAAEVPPSIFDAQATLADVELWLLPPDMVADDSSARIEGEVLEIRLVKAALGQDVLTVKARWDSTVCTRTYGSTTAQAQQWAGWGMMLYVRQELVFDGPVVASHEVWGGNKQPGLTYDDPGSHVVLTAQGWVTALLRRRVVETASGGKYSKTDTPNRIAADLIRTNCVAAALVTPTDWQTDAETRDDFENITVTCDVPVAAGTSTTYKADCGENLLDVLLELCNSAASDEDWLWPVATRTGTTVDFTFLRGRSGGSRGIGTDRTTAGSGMLGGGPISAERGNLIGYEKVIDRSQLENHYTGTGQGRGAGMRRHYIASTSSISANGVYEGWGPVPSASDSTELAHELQRLIHERATGHVQHRVHMIEIDGAQWPTDFDIADSLPIYTPAGETLSLVAIGLVWTLVAPGPARLEVDLGKWPALIERQLGRSGGGGGGGGRGGGGRPRSKSGESEVDPDDIKGFLTVTTDGDSAVADDHADTLAIIGSTTNTPANILTDGADDPEEVGIYLKFEGVEDVDESEVATKRVEVQTDAGTYYLRLYEIVSP